MIFFHCKILLVKKENGYILLDMDTFFFKYIGPRISHFFLQNLGRSTRTYFLLLFVDDALHVSMVYVGMYCDLWSLFYCFVMLNNLKKTFFKFVNNVLSISMSFCFNNSIHLKLCFKKLAQKLYFVFAPSTFCTFFSLIYYIITYFPNIL